MVFGYIYLIIDHLHNKVYVGQRTGDPDQTKNYYGGGKIIKNIIKKRKHHLQKIVLGVCCSQKELDEAETECIYFYRSFGSDGKHYDEIYGYNLVPIGKKGSNNMTNHPDIENISKRISDANKGKKPWNKGLTKETDTRIYRAGLLESTNKKEKFAKGTLVIWNKNKKNVYSEVAIEKMRKTKKGKLLSQTHKQSISEGIKGEKNPNYNHDLDTYVNEMIAMKESGSSIYSIAKKFNCSDNAILYRLKNYGKKKKEKK